MPEIPLTNENYDKAVSWAGRNQDSGISKVELKARINSEQLEGNLFMVDGDPLILLKGYPGSVTRMMTYAGSHEARLIIEGFVDSKSLKQQGAQIP